MIDDLLLYIQRTIAHYITSINIESTRSSLSVYSSYYNISNSMDMPENSSIVLNVEQFIRDVENRPAIWNRNYHCNKLFMEQTWDELSALHKLSKQTLKTKWKGLRDNFRVEYKRIPRNENGEFLIPPEAHDSKWTHYQSLLFLTEHMRHRNPKTDSAHNPYNYNNSSAYRENDQEYEINIVEPDLTNGLIQIPDEDDEESPNNTNTSITSHTTSINHHHHSHRHHQPASLQRLNECNSNDSAVYSASGSIIVGNNGIIVPPVTLKRKRNSQEDDENQQDIKPNLSQLIEPPDTDDDYHYLLSLHPYMKQFNRLQKLRLRTKIQKLIFKELYEEGNGK